MAGIKTGRPAVETWVRLTVDEETRRRARRLAALCDISIQQAVEMAVQDTLQRMEREAAEFAAGS
jgi:hypothetical protein